MRVTPDAQFLNILSRDTASREAASRRGESEGSSFARQSAISDAYARRAEPVRTATALAKEQPKAEERPQNSSQAGRREAPLGPRPKFTPKGQSINILV
jgi:hypothetical protein